MAKVNFNTRVQQEVKDTIQELVNNNNITNEDIVVAGVESFLNGNEEASDSKIIKITDKNLIEKIEDLTGEDGYFYEEDLIEAGVKTLSTEEAILDFNHLDLIEKVEELEPFFTAEEVIKLAHAVHDHKFISEEDYNYLQKCKELKIDPEEIKNDKEKTYEKHIEKAKKYLQKQNFDLKNFEEYELDLSVQEERYKLVSLSAWIPFKTLMITAQKREFFVVKVDYQFDRISFGEIGKEEGITLPMKEIFKNLSTVKLYKLKDLDSLES